MEKIDWLSYQQDMESAFWLDCSAEDIRDDAEAKTLYKQLIKQRRRINKVNKLAKKILYPRTSSG
jgi:hypothetical protein